MRQYASTFKISILLYINRERNQPIAHLINYCQYLQIISQMELVCTRIYTVVCTIEIYKEFLEQKKFSIKRKEEQRNYTDILLRNMKMFGKYSTFSLTCVCVCVWQVFLRSNTYSTCVDVIGQCYGGIFFLPSCMGSGNPIQWSSLCCKHLTCLAILPAGLRQGLGQ